MWTFSKKKKYSFFLINKEHELLLPWQQIRTRKYKRKIIRRDTGVRAFIESSFFICCYPRSWCSSCAVWKMNWKLNFVFSTIKLNFILCAVAGAHCVLYPAWAQSMVFFSISRCIICSKLLLAWLFFRIQTSIERIHILTELKIKHKEKLDDFYTNKKIQIKQKSKLSSSKKQRFYLPF